MSKNLKQCPACGNGELHSHSEPEQFEYAGVTLVAEDFFSVCDSCGTEIATPEDIRKGNRSRIHARKLHEGLLSGEEIKEFRKTFGLSQDIAANLFGGGKVAFSKYENNDVAQSEPMDSLLRLCIQNPFNLLLLAGQKHLGLPSDAMSRIKDHYIEQLVDIAPSIQKTLDAQLAKHRRTSIQVCANESINTRTAQVVEIRTWKKAA